MRGAIRIRRGRPAKSSLDVNKPASDADVDERGRRIAFYGSVFCVRGRRRCCGSWWRSSCQRSGAASVTLLSSLADLKTGTEFDVYRVRRRLSTTLRGGTTAPAGVTVVRVSAARPTRPASPRQR